jgi:hypothetical protein
LSPAVPPATLSRPKAGNGLSWLLFVPPCLENRAPKNGVFVVNHWISLYGVVEIDMIWVSGPPSADEAARLQFDYCVTPYGVTS